MRSFDKQYLSVNQWLIDKSYESLDITSLAIDEYHRKSQFVKREGHLNTVNFQLTEISIEFKTTSTPLTITKQRQLTKK